MSIGKINASLAGGLTQETTLALANLNFDFSLCKVEAPMEYQGLGECLSKRRRAAAESGNEHRMARKLGALFSHTLPATPNLVRAYGKRATEIICESSKRVSSSKRNDGVFGEWTGPDATSIWAAATSGAGAIAAHLLACMLARMWTASEAAAVWEEIIESRKLEITNSDPGTPLWQSQELAAKVETTREQISMWDSSARSWLEIADRSRMKQQKQLKLLVDDAGIPVNQASTTYRSVMDAWTTALSTVEKLLEGVSQSINNGAVILALTSWHVFPDMFVVGAGPNIIHQNDSLYPKGTVITLGQSSRAPSASSDGVFWSLPLAFLKYYGDPVVRTRTLGESTSRLTFSELMQVVLGSVLAGWGDYALDVEKACTNIVSIADFLSTDRHQEPNRPRAWIHLLGESAESFLAEAGSTQPLLRSLTMRGLRRYKHLLWESDEAHAPIFGLASSNTVLKLIDDMEDKISFLRLVARQLKNASHCNTIIRYRVRKQYSVKPYSQQSIFVLSQLHRNTESDEDDDSFWRSEWSWEYATAIEEVQNEKARNRKYTDLRGHIRWTDREAFTADSGEAYIQAVTPATNRMDSKSRSFYWDDSGTTSSKFLPETKWVCVFGNPNVAAIFTPLHKSSIGTVTPLAHFQGSQSADVGPAAPAACLNCVSSPLPLLNPLFALSIN